MDIEQALYARLAADPGVSALVAARIYPEQAPQADAFPLITYSEASRGFIYALAARINLDKYSMHLDCYALSYAAARAVRAAVIACLDSLRETIGAGTVAVLGAFLETGDGGVEAPIHADEQGVFRAGLDLDIHYRTVP